MKARITIRASAYRGKAGFTVNSGAGKSCFCTSRAQAEAYRELLRADLPAGEHCARSFEILCNWVGG